MAEELADESEQTKVETTDHNQHYSQFAAEEATEEPVLAVKDQVPVEGMLGQVGDQVAADHYQHLHVAELWLE